MQYKFTQSIKQTLMVTNSTRSKDPTKMNVLQMSYVQMSYQRLFKLANLKTLRFTDKGY